MGGSAKFSLRAMSAEVIGPYQLGALLGEGGMGAVYRARHMRTGAEVALKLVQVADESLLASFRREIFALRSVDHPGVVQVIADGVTAGCPWYAMVLYEGRTVGDFIEDVHEPGCDRFDSGIQTLSDEDANAETLPHMATAAPSGPPALGRTLTLIRTLCAALAYVHGKGLVHRDLKPDNVLIGDDGVPVVVDFGLALQFCGERTRDVLAVAGRALGTPPYMAPEQIRGDLVDARADLYALGCILFECLTGQQPFFGSPSRVLQQHLFEKPEPPSALMDQIPAELDALVMRLLEKEPRRRLGYAADVAATLAGLGAELLPLVGAPAPRPYLYRPALAGRSAAIERLEPLLGCHRDDQRSSMILVGGPSGVGKTRLVMELATTAARRGRTVVVDQCVDVGPKVRAAPLHPFAELLGAIADRCRVEGRDETARILGERGRVLELIDPSLAELPGQAEYPIPPPLPADAARLRLLDVMASVIAAYAEGHPCLLVLDDLQWADELTLALLQNLDDDYLARAQLLVLTTYRVEDLTAPLQGLIDAEHTEAIELGPLSRQSVAQMVADMLALNAPPSGLIDFLVTESEGNPFFIAEYLRAAIDERVLQRSEAGDWVVGERGESPQSLRSALPLPGGLRELVRRRFAQLDDDAQELARMAAVLGRELDGDLLLAASATLWALSVRSTDAPKSSDSFDDVRERYGREPLQQLRARQILEEASGGKLRFVHDRVRACIYSDIHPQQRPELHRAAAEAIERDSISNPSRTQAYFPILAHHWSIAGDEVKTLEYLEKAGELALASAASTEAKGFFSRALSLAEQRQCRGLPGDEMRHARWQRRLGEACYNLGDLHVAKRHLRNAMQVLAPARLGALSKLAPERLVDRLGSGLSTLGALGKQLGRLAGLSRAVRGDSSERGRLREAALAAERLSQTYFFLNQQNRAFGAALKAAHFAEALGPSAELARGYGVLSIGFGFAMLPSLVERYGQQAQDIAKQVADPHAIAFVAFLRGLSALGAGEHSKARAFLRHALDTARTSGDVRANQEILAVLGHAHVVAGDAHTGLSLFEQLGQSVDRSPNAQGQLWVLSGRGSTLIKLGRADEGIQLLVQARELNANTDDRTQQIAHGAVAMAYQIKEQCQQARSAAEQTLQLSERAAPTGYHLCLGLFPMCEVLLASWERALSDDKAQAKELAQLCARACSVTERYARIFALGRARAQLYRGCAHWLDGRSSRAQSLWRKSLETATGLDIPFDRGRAHFELGRHLAPSDPARKAHLARAAALFRQTGAEHWLKRLRTETT